MNAIQMEVRQWEERFEAVGWRITIGDARGWKAMRLGSEQETRFCPTLKSLLRHCRALNRVAA